MPVKVKKKQISKRINPRIVDVEIGIHDLRKIKVYPLSMQDQKELTKLINKVLKSIFAADTKKKDDKNLIFISLVVKAIEENIEEIFKYVIPDEDIGKVMKEIDNAQLSEIVKVVYQTNYETPVKNVMSLFQQEQLQSVLKRPLSQSVENMGTNLNTSLNEVTKKED